MVLTLLLAACANGCSNEMSGMDGEGAGGSMAGGGLVDSDVEDGRKLWSQLCASCHGDFLPATTLSSGNANGDFRLDAVSAIERHGVELEAYIDSAMPFGSADLCVGKCAEQLGSYLRSIQPPSAVACEGDSGPAVGTQKVLLLNSREYQNALEDLLGVPSDFGSRVENHDGLRGGFVDMSGQTVSSTLLDTYTRNADAAAAWAVSNGRPFDCSEPEQCAQRFVDEFLPVAFRGPVSDAQQAAYRELFSQFPGDGLKLALKAALTSPLFLYRLEVGVSLDEAHAAGYYDPASTASSSGGFATSGVPTEFKASSEFAPDSSGRLQGDEWMLDQNGRIRVQFGQGLADPAVVEVVARGSNHGDVWPELTLHVNGSAIGTQRVDRATAQAYRFDVTGQSGATSVEIAFENDSGEPPYGPGQDANLFVQQVSVLSVSAAGASGASQGSKPSPGPSTSGVGGLLDGATPGMTVLTPFEFAATLAFSVTGSTPDQALLQAASAGQLATREQVRYQVERLVDSDRGREHLGNFVTRWFRLDGLTEVSRPDVPELTDDVKDAMLEEVRRHFQHVFYDESVPWSEFFGGDYTFLNRTLAEFYGIPGQFDDSFQKTPVDRRGGPLASGAFMTINAHAERTAPILRAVRSRQTALCHYIDPPNSPIAGDDIDAQRAAAQERVTEQEQSGGPLSSRDFYFFYTDGIDACAGCHERLINPMFGMEDFDNAGRLRPAMGATAVLENVRGVDTPVSIEGTLYGVSSTSDATTIAYAGAKDLSNQLADTAAVNECLARQTFRFLTGTTYVDRDLDADHRETLTAAQRSAYSCVATRMLDAFETHGQSPRAMFIELATDNLLLFRR